MANRLELALPLIDVSASNRTIPQKRVEQEKKPSEVQVMLVGMQGEGGFSMHDPIGIGVLAKRIKTDHPGIHVEQFDTQPELAETGKIDTDALAKRLHEFATKPDNEDKTTIIGFGMTIYSANYTQSVIEKYRQLCEDEPPKGNVEIVLGGSIPTHTDPKRVKEMFPGAKLVRGEGEERMSFMVQQALAGEELTESPRIEWADLRNYQGADRQLTRAIVDRGGKPKIETSRGCGHGSCTFCSRSEMQEKPDKSTPREIPLVVSGRNGNDYRTIPVPTIIGEIRELQHLYADDNEHRVGEILETFTPRSMEDTAEDSFADIEHTKALVSALKAEQLDENDPLPRIPFGASLRVETLNKLATTKVGNDGSTLLQQLQEVGLDQVFLGVEGGSDAYLKQIAKHQKVSKVDEALQHIDETVWVNEEGKEQKLNIEMGFITFSWRMTMDMLKANIEFLDKYSPYVTSLFNQLEVRANTIDERILRESVYGRSRADGSVVKPELPEQFNGYDPDTAYNINTSTYENVPYFDAEVGRVLQESITFAQADESLYYALKSVNRAGSLPEHLKDKARKYYLQMKALHLDFLKNAAGIDDIPDVKERRRALIQEMGVIFGAEPQGDILDSVRREAHAFMREEKERQEAENTQIGALLVAQDERDRVLLVRPRNQDTWGFPGGNVHKGETPVRAVIRESVEELGIEKADVEIKQILPVTIKNGHNDHTTGDRDRLRLHHFGGIIKGHINILEADHEIADTIWLSRKDILEGKVAVHKNVPIAVGNLPGADGEEKTVYHRIFH